MSQLQDQVALITGATRGIGKAILAELAEMGATVIGTATSEAGAATITENIQALGAKGKGIVLNVTDPDAIQDTVKQVASEFGPIYILVNNAGITRDNLLMRMKQDEWDSIMDTNLTSIFRLSKACLRGMLKQQGGRIINISSVVGYTGNPGQCNYSAAKAGILGFSKSLAQEVASRNITVNVVAPGFIETDMTKDLPQEQAELMQNMIALGRLGQPEDIAAAVGFLASPKAGYITGQTIHVNGGMT